MLRDSVKQIDIRLKNQKFLLGDTVSEADKLLYKTLLRLDYIYYYIYKINEFKSFDYENINRYLGLLASIDEVSKSIDIDNEKRLAFSELDEARNPYHLVFAGPQ